MTTSIRFKDGDIIYKMNDGKIDTNVKYKIKSLKVEDECNWHSGYDVTIKATIYKLGVSSNTCDTEEEYILQYMNHVYNMDNIYAIIAELSPPTSPSLTRTGSIGWKTL